MGNIAGNEDSLRMPNPAIGPIPSSIENDEKSMVTDRNLGHPDGVCGRIFTRPILGRRPPQATLGHRDAA